MKTILSMHRCAIVMAAAGLLAGVTGAARASDELARKSACMACHAAQEKVVGPSYADVAKKYAGQPGATAKVAEAIRSGGVGQWGKTPMPAQAQLSEGDAKLLATWILATKPN